TMAPDGSLGDYCQVLKTQGIDATIDFQIYRPIEDAIYEGQFNGKELELVSSGNSQGDDGGTVDSFVTVTDDSGTVSVNVPSNWNQIDGSSFTDDSGATYYDVTATTDLANYNSSWSVPGVRVTASEDAFGSDLMQIIDNYKSGVGADCTVGNEGAYDDSYYIGQFVYFTGCGGTSTDYAVVVANDANNTHLMILTVQMVTDSDKDVVLDNVLNSFQAVF
ncbi:MAG TPA: hypothetical protein VFS93_08710, partial [Terrimesophilobacter sp.]|nr:hypothetical protein [Terrimesophilobacter sp.]